MIFYDVIPGAILTDSKQSLDTRIVIATPF